MPGANVDMSARPSTPPVAPAVVEPFFMASPQGPLFCVHHRPSPSVPCRGQVLVAPPFNEEMNRCRSMQTLLAQALAREGIGTLVVDLYGTGDSAGEHRDARWDIWLDNLARGLAWLDGQGGAFRALLGVRLGVALAAETVRRSGRRDLALLAWQPVVDGKLHFTQFLRIRLAAMMDRTDLPKESTASLRQQLAEGRNVEVGGYEVSPGLAAAIEAASLAVLTPPAGTPVLWLEQAVADAQSVTPVSQKLIDAWRAAGVAPDVSLFQGPAFWQMHERVVAPQAVAMTTAWVLARLDRMGGA